MRALILSLLFSSKLAAFEVPAFDYYNFSCLVRNAYHEARGESIERLEAVTQVVLNRMRINRKEACEIIYKPAQFSWTTVPPSVSESEYRVVEARLWARLVRHAPVFRRHGG